MKFTYKVFLVYFIFSMPSCLVAQQKLDTIFYNQNWKETKVKDSISFYRLATKVNGKYEVRDYYVNKTLQMTGAYTSIVQDIKDGFFKYFDEFGKLSSQGNYKKNLKNGVWKNYKNNKLWTETNYLNDTMHGNFMVYYPNGTVKRNEVYKNGKILNGLCYAQNGNDTTYYPFEILPEYIGGVDEMIRAINYYTEYPKAALENKIDGKVILRFYIDVDGSIGDIKVLSSSPDILNQSAIQCLKKMPKWNPGKEDGEPIKVYYWLPFVFKSDQYYQTPKE